MPSEWAERNKERLKAYRKERHARTYVSVRKKPLKTESEKRDKRDAWFKKWRAENKERLREKARERYALNLDEKRKQQRARSRRFYAAHPDYRQRYQAPLEDKWIALATEQMNARQQSLLAGLSSRGRPRLPMSPPDAQSLAG